MFNSDILLCDLDAFYASVEQRDNEGYRGKPVVVGGSIHRGVVAACSYEAREFGIRSAMSMGRALELCPQAIVLPVNMKRYRQVSQQVVELLKEFTPDIEPVSVDEAYLAVKKHTGQRIGEFIRQEVKKRLELPVTIGVSSNKLLAKIACGLAKPDGMKSLWLEDIFDTLWPLPVDVLPGVGPATENKLKRYGFKKVGDLAGSREETLYNILGSSGLRLYQYAQGRDDRVLEKKQQAKSVSEETTFPQDIGDREYVLGTLMELSEGVGYGLRSKGLYARTISLKLRFSDFKTITRDITLPQATNRDIDIYNSVSLLFVCHHSNPPWRLVGVKASNLERFKQIAFFDDENEKEEKIIRIQDNFRKKYGKEMICRARRLHVKGKKKKDTVKPDL